MSRLMGEYEHLCTLGLPTSEVVPLALSLLERMVGGGLTCFVWANDRCEAENSYILEDIPQECPRLYAEEYYNRREAEMGPTFTEMLRGGIALVNFSRLGTRMFNSAMHAELFDAFGLRHLTRVAVMDGEHRHGMLAFSRSRGDRAHSEQEEGLLLRAGRFLAYAFELERAARLVRGETTESAESGFLLLGGNGRLLHGSDLGLHLFHEATRADGLHHHASEVRADLPATLLALAGKKGPSQEITIKNRRGEFVFRPFALRSTATGTDAPVAVTIHRRGSLAACLWQASGRFRLSGRERQVAVLLGLGNGYDAIAGHLDISRNTAVCYVRRTYEKLGVSQREQIARTLLTGAPA